MDTKDCLDWSEVVDAIKPIITVWTLGSELRWAEHAWGTLTEAGLTDYTTELERTQCLLRAVALGALYRDFCARAFDEGSLDEWRYYVGSDLIGAHPLIDGFTLGQLTEREGIEVDNAPFDDSQEVAEALRELVDGQYPTVLRELRTRWHDDNLFASLFASTGADVVYPLAEEQVFEIVNTDTTSNKSIAWEWLTDGCPFEP